MTPWDRRALARHFGAPRRRRQSCSPPQNPGSAIWGTLLEKKQTRAHVLRATMPQKFAMENKE
jgi:hypothetical protein